MRKLTPEQEAALKRGQETVRNQSKETAREKGRKGGIATAKARRERADLAKAIETLLSMEATGKTKEHLKKMGFEEDGLTNANALVATIFSQAMGGSSKAQDTLMQYIRQVNEDKIKADESKARICAMEKNGVDISVSSQDDNDGGVMIYLPQVEEEPEESNEETE